MSPLMHAVYAKRRRDRLRAQGLCINGATHGPAVRGGRCQLCLDRRAGLAPRSRIRADEDIPRRRFIVLPPPRSTSSPGNPPRAGNRLSERGGGSSSEVRPC